MKSKLSLSRSSCRLAILLALNLGVHLGTLTADGAIVYDTFAASDHILSIWPSATPDRPFGSWLGNTVSLDGSARFLTEIKLRLATTLEKIEAQTISLMLYDLEGPEDPGKSGLPQPSQAFATAQTVVEFEKGIATATFAFESIFVPGTFTFAAHFETTEVSEKYQLGFVTSDNGPGIGQANETLWYGEPGEVGWATNSEWAILDGAKTNFLAATISAETQPGIVVPEPGTGLLLALSASALMLLRRPRQSGVVKVG